MMAWLGLGAQNSYSSTEHDNSTNCLSKFKCLSQSSKAYQQNHTFPLERSGHRCYCDNNYFYVVGGYKMNTEPVIVKEFWALNLTSFQWRRYRLNSDFPNELASFSLSQTSSFSKNVIIFGGSGAIFGISSSNDTFILNVDNEKCKVTATHLETTGSIPQPKYGQAMSAGENYNKFYIVGGTEGHIFDMKIHSLEFNPEVIENEAGEKVSKIKWNWSYINENMSEMVGRYRMEAAFDEKSHLLIFFGGGEPDFVLGFEALDAFDVVNKKNTTVIAHSDDNGVYPEARRCHSLSRHERNIVIVGGSKKERRNRMGIPYTELLNDVWIFNLDSRKWRKHHDVLPKPVFFHDSAVTKDGLLIVFGGVTNESSGERTNEVQTVWLSPPTLKSTVLQLLRENNANFFKGVIGGGFTSSQIDTREICQRMWDSNYCKTAKTKDIERLNDLPLALIDGEVEYDNGVLKEKKVMTELGLDYPAFIRAPEEEEEE